MEADELLLQVEGLFLVEHFREGIYRDIHLKWIDMAILIHFNGEHGDKALDFWPYFQTNPCRYVYLDLDSGCFYWNRKIMHWSDDKHEISWDTHHIHESHTSTSKWRWSFQHPERIYPFGGNGETPDAFFGKRTMHPDVRQIFARYRMLFSQRSKCTAVWIGYIIKPNAFRTCDLLAL